MDSLTDRRCRSKLLALLERLCDRYERAEPVRPEFWSALDRIDRRLTEMLSPRPIGVMQIDQACHEAEAAFNSALRGYKQARDPATASGT